MKGQKCSCLWVRLPDSKRAAQPVLFIGFLCMMSKTCKHDSTPEPWRGASHNLRYPSTRWEPYSPIAVLHNTTML